MNVLLSVSYRKDTLSALDTTEYFSVELDTVNDFEQAQRLIPSQLY
jgi:hypothetical protein